MVAGPAGRESRPAATLLMRFFAAYVALALILMSSVFALGYVEAAAPTRPTPLQLHGPCVPAILGPVTRFYCANRRGYDRYPDGHWQDAGPIPAAQPGLGYSG